MTQAGSVASLPLAVCWLSAVICVVTLLTRRDVEKINKGKLKIPREELECLGGKADPPLLV